MKKQPLLCNKCLPSCNAFIDLSCIEDAKLKTIASLLECFGSLDLLEEQTVRDLGFAISDYLDRKVVREHVFFSRSLLSCKLSELELRSELSKVKSRRKEAMGQN